jgi:outer membrane protein assembly factor BamD (BamD/ComL family)
MHVSAASNSASQYQGLQPAQSNPQKFQSEFLQIGKDLQSGNLAQAKTDFATLQSQRAANPQTTPSGVSSAFQKLSLDLQSGNLSAAKQDYASLQQDFKQQSTSAGSIHRHRHHSGASQDSSNDQNPLDQMFPQLSQSLQSGSAANAQTTYASLQQEFGQLGVTPTSQPGSSSASASAASPFSAFA